MKQPVSFLTQSRFYSPMFNAAIFDGPFRIYFSQIHEPLALKMFFHLQKNLGEQYSRSKTIYRQNQDHIFLMLYPSLEAYGQSFPQHTPDSLILQERLGKDYVLGIHPDFSEIHLDHLLPVVDKIIAYQAMELPELVVESNP